MQGRGKYNLAKSDTVLETFSLTKSFGGGLRRKQPFIAVNDLNLKITPGQVYGFLGPNGAGKSTTLRMLLNLMHPTHGRAFIFGEDPAKNPEVLRRVGWLVEGATFYSYLKAWDNLQVVGLSQGNFDEKRATELLDFVGLGDKAKVRVGKFSTGMKQRLGIAAALLSDPDLVILDEPTNGMDPMGIREMRKFIRSLAEEHGKTVLLTSHLLDEVEQTCDRVAIINRGEIKIEGSIDTLLHSESWVEAEVSSIEKAKQALTKWSSEATPEPNILRIQTTREYIPEVVKTLVEQNVELYRIGEVQRSLEEFFLNVIGEDTNKGRLQ